MEQVRCEKLIDYDASDALFIYSMTFTSDYILSPDVLQRQALSDMQCGIKQRLGERGERSTSLRKLLPHLANWMQTSSAGKGTEKNPQVEASSLETASQGELSTPTVTEPCE